MSKIPRKEILRRTIDGTYTKILLCSICISKALSLPTFKFNWIRFRFKDLSFESCFRLLAQLFDRQCSFSWMWLCFLCMLSFISLSLNRSWLISYCWRTLYFLLFVIGEIEAQYLFFEWNQLTVCLFALVAAIHSSLFQFYLFLY